MFAFDKPLTWIIILLIVLLIFGAGKLPDIGKSLGKSIKEFKDETRTGLGDEVKKADEPVATTTLSSPSLSQPETTTIRRRIIKHPDGREEIIEEPVVQK
jgi:sec-independent protein translocase protein TatA